MPKTYRLMISSKILSEKMKEFDIQSVNEVKLIDIGLLLHTDEDELFIPCETQMHPSEWLIQSNVRWDLIKGVCAAINEMPIMLEIDNYLCKLIIHY